MDIEKVKGIGSKTSLLFNKLNVFTLDDLLRFIHIDITFINQ